MTQDQSLLPWKRRSGVISSSPPFWDHNGNKSGKCFELYFCFSCMIYFAVHTTILLSYINYSELINSRKIQLWYFFASNNALWSHSPLCYPSFYTPFPPHLSFKFHPSPNIPHMTESMASFTLRIWLISLKISQILLIFLNMGWFSTLWSNQISLLIYTTF